MSDAIDTLCKDCGFDDVLNKKKKEIISMVRYIIRTYEVFYGENSVPEGDVVKRVLRTFVEFWRESISLSLTSPSPDIRDKVLDRVIERIFKGAIPELIKDGTLKYVS